MGMFDWVQCEYELPMEDAPLSGWQTKDTPAQRLDTYRIDKNGLLWGQEYDVVDRSDPNAEGWRRIIGMCTRENIRDVRCNMTGEIRFYTSRKVDGDKEWIEFSAYFKDGEMQILNCISETT